MYIRLKHVHTHDLENLLFMQPALFLNLYLFIGTEYIRIRVTSPFTDLPFFNFSWQKFILRDLGLSFKKYYKVKGIWTHQTLPEDVLLRVKYKYWKQTIRECHVFKAEVTLMSSIDWKQNQKIYIGKKMVIYFMIYHFSFNRNTI